MTPNELTEGMRVTYISFNSKEHGIVKSIQNDRFAFVVYNCAGKWDQYKNYTAARTDIKSLVKGWL